MKTLKTNTGASLDRRTFARAGLLAAAGVVGSSALGGCALLGIEDPNANQDETVDDPGLVDFDRVEIRFNIEPSTWQWSIIDDTASAWNGYLVAAIPVSAVNANDTAVVMSSMYCKIYGPDGAQQEDLSGRYGDDFLNTGNMRTGSTASGQMHFLYRGPGIYQVKFDNLLGRKTTFELEITYSDRTAVKPFPSYVNEYNAWAAIPQGESFDVGGLTIALTNDASAYTWSFISAPGDEYWDGRGAAGIPIRVTNNSTSPISFSSVFYQSYSTDTYALPDASWAYPDSAANSLSVIQPNQTVNSMLYVVYEYSQVTCWCIFCNQGIPVVASIWIP